MEEIPGKTLLDKPAVAPTLLKSDFFNGLLGRMSRRPKDATIGRGFLRHPSTVGYWGAKSIAACQIGSRKCGLRSRFARLGG